MPATSNKEIKMTNCRPCNEAISDNLAETRYCDYSHPDIQALSRDISQNARDTHALIEKVFLFVRDTIAFGGDHWQVKASETLSKGYGACFNKNLLMISILRALKIPCKLMANPMNNSFTKPSVGSAYLYFSNPFYHCFTPMQISAAKQNPDLASLPPNEKVLLKLVLKAVRDPALTGQNDIDALCEQGWSHQVIFDAVFLGRLMIVMGMMMKTFNMSED